MGKKKQLSQTFSYFNKTPFETEKNESPILKYDFEEITRCMLQGIKKGIAVDLGCNNGKYTSQLALYFEEIFGLDYAEKALFSAPKKQNITYEVIDLNINANKLLKYRNVDKYVAIAIFEDVGILAVEISGGLTVPWRYEVLSGGRWPWKNVDDLGLCKRGTQHQEKHCCVRKHDEGKWGGCWFLGWG